MPQCRLGAPVRPPALTKRQRAALAELASHRRSGELRFTQFGGVVLTTPLGTYLIQPSGYVTRLRRNNEKGMK